MTLENVLLLLGGMGLAFAIYHVARKQGWEDASKVHTRLYEQILEQQSSCDCPPEYAVEEDEEHEEWQDPERN